MERYLTIGMVLSGLFFGWTVGSHYTGATMGMAYGAGVIKKPRTALPAHCFLCDSGRDLREPWPFTVSVDIINLVSSICCTVLIIEHAMAGCLDVP
jgi:hypothetical protein